MGKKERHARTAKAEKSSFSKLHNKIRKKGKNKGKLPQSAKSQRKRVEQYGFDLTQAARPQLEKLPVRVNTSIHTVCTCCAIINSGCYLLVHLQEDDLRAMSFVRGEGRQGNKQQLINGLLGFKMKIQKREVREHLYAQYLAVRGNSDRAVAAPTRAAFCRFATCTCTYILNTVGFRHACSAAPKCTSSQPLLLAETYSRLSN